jgi:hypothetical protein
LSQVKSKESPTDTIDELKESYLMGSSLVQKDSDNSDDDIPIVKELQ